ncbi:UDP-N-acetylmuramoyl-L-alanine--D-glutamate ligase [Oleiphilus sp. HI0068]|uniref:UDP-N-acetylmuramoyl-L-alanine--D-glutamate ligase n=2 Tax=unclassified Oleiphilus TaxID=2631174 RepID=UPI0007C363BC|nr:UDP-N-acetylmuramoyl-L-alanine--D-glutamate ligase [Oleiphilus sp. HI0132]KZY64923.1 UDP-N-acetylmuramoyl-L-alanine--D-glutamate ligase [Oleiphilus sp. HI0061]KZY75499.1 UDP-N-acetylmuramoyl-L-alanine--D-glutamate ligase [Oleiphilus sp. HI0069]KZY76745.1 UDP-N-acetylmuramoyl-L-alanine--D-glutamate ligase [Oleiphilus sp. HI0068]KZZ43298.1 UDP-N-acetylmuramoyl-L-alanine--D-glutamate ligase [Oleiphilus sp. HI0085]KZZ73816.1 UDP-N-acetylmuramoyl-L-alanine--D-glutamate ligase [Oleiphilus sp. HI0
MNTIVTDKKVVIVGLGKTGLSCVRFLASQGCQLCVMDSREEPPGLEGLHADYPNVQCITGGFDQELLCSATEIILSPGIALATPEIQAAIKSGVRVRGDIDLFSEAAKAPIVAITGSNGKSTVTTLLGEMAEQAGLNVGVGGNLGTPALELLDNSCELYILELSSFQLETTDHLSAESVVMLNLSEDHMDRYESKIAYLQAKQRIFFGAKKVIVNDDEVLSQPLQAEGMELLHFGLNRADLNKFSCMDIDGQRHLVKGFDSILPVKDLKICGEHNLSNALAALALGTSVGLPMDAMANALKSYKGLRHRCQHIRSVDGVDYINDSKGTNAGAAQTAISSIGANLDGKVLLIAGGDSKGADISGLLEPMQKFGKLALLFGQDAELIEAVLKDKVETLRVANLEQAVQQAKARAEEGDAVLLSPACASFDMFKSYEQRGDMFEQEVLAL